MLVTGLLGICLLLAAAVAIRSRGQGDANRKETAIADPERDVSPERRLWEIWKRLGWGERLTMLALMVGGLGAVSLGLYLLVLLVW